MLMIPISVTRKCTQSPHKRNRNPTNPWYIVAVKQNARATDTGNAVEADGCLANVKPKARSDDQYASPTAGVVILVLLILLAIATVIVLAWIGPVASGDSTNTILAG
jgi:hypothetical protein